MSAAQQRQEVIAMTEAEYLAFERNSEIKHEYLNGEVFAMTGASWEHNMICASVIASLVNQVRGSSCQVSPSDLRLQVSASGLFAYPDISVICGEPIFTDPEFDTIINPTAIIEILSPTTERYDRGEKFQYYRQIGSFQDYLLIAQDQPRIEGYSRQSDGSWRFTDASGLDARFEIASIRCTLALAEVYERVTFGTDEAEEGPAGTDLA